MNMMAKRKKGFECNQQRCGCFGQCLSKYGVAGLKSQFWNRSMISEETAQRVRDAANQLGYSPNPIARALRGERTNMIGLIVREITDPFFAGLIEILNSEARNAASMWFWVMRTVIRVKGFEMARILDSRQMDGVIFLGDLRNDKEVLQSYINENHPIVPYAAEGKFPVCRLINCDNKLGIRMLTEHLCDLGHQLIAFIDGGWFGDVLERREEFLRIKRETSKCSQFSWIQAADDDYNGGYGVINEILKS